VNFNKPLEITLPLRPAMNKEDASFLEFVDIIENMAKLHEWESKNLPLLNSLTGRSLYYRIAQRALSGDSNSNTMKDLILDSDFTEKSLRNRLNIMEEDGFVISTQSEVDGRSKFPVPREKFYAAMYLHAGQIKRILGENYLVLKK
jgi:hypothetical protein